MISASDGSTLGKVATTLFAIRCAASDCQKLTLRLNLNEFKGYGPQSQIGYTLGSLIEKWHLRPDSNAKPQPDYIPPQIREDYEEACKIRDLSAKASGTTSRRCLQGMIRDFCGISKNRLVDEINELRSKVDAGQAPIGVQPDTVDAIDAVRGIGNIGAHMEKDINVIVDIDPNEAQVLIGLIELLFREWYIARHVRQGRLAALAELAGVKQLERKAPPKALPAPDEGEKIVRCQSGANRVPMFRFRCS